MWVSDVALDDYRSYRHVVVSLHPGVNILLGPNGQGKTNFVEALHYVSTFRSHRVNADNALVRIAIGRDGVISEGDSDVDTQLPRGAVVRLKLHVDGRERLIDVEIVAGRANRARLNRNVVPPREIRGMMHSVLFAPEDISIVRTDPATRRRFLDELASQGSLQYASWMSDYTKIASQRAAMLRSLKYAPGSERAAAQTMLDVWNDQLVNVGALIIAERARLVRQLEPLAFVAHADVCGGVRDLSLKYEPHLPGVDSEKLYSEVAGSGRVDGEGKVHGAGDADVVDADSADSNRAVPGKWEDIHFVTQVFHESLKANAAKEVERGVNLAGPHRDDLDIYLDGIPVKGFASHGETWSVALALRLGEYELLSQILEDKPVLILDDVFAELDVKRREALRTVIDEAEQVFITAAVADDVPDLSGAHFYDVRLEHDDEGQLATTITAQELGDNTTGTQKLNGVDQHSGKSKVENPGVNEDGDGNE